MITKDYPALQMAVIVQEYLVIVTIKCFKLLNSYFLLVLQCSDTCMKPTVWVYSLCYNIASVYTLNKHL